MNPCTNHCTPNDYVCRSCGRTDEERAEWNALSEPMQRQIMRRISIEKHLANALLTTHDEIDRLNFIIRELEQKI